MIIIQKFQANNHLAVIFPPRRRERSGQLRNLNPTVFASVAKDYRPSASLSSQVQRSDPLLRFTIQQENGLPPRHGGSSQ